LEPVFDKPALKTDNSNSLITRAPQISALSLLAQRGTGQAQHCLKITPKIAFRFRTAGHLKRENAALMAGYYFFLFKIFPATNCTSKIKSKFPHNPMIPENRGGGGRGQESYMSSYPNRCQHIKINGTQCGSPALRRNRFCFFHKAIPRRADQARRRPQASNQSHPSVAQPIVRARKHEVASPKLQPETGGQTAEAGSRMAEHSTPKSMHAVKEDKERKDAC
jgi:hypothetical protein